MSLYICDVLLNVCDKNPLYGTKTYTKILLNIECHEIHKNTVWREIFGDKYFRKFTKSRSLSKILFPKNQLQSSSPVNYDPNLARIDKIPKFNFRNMVFIVISENIYLQKFPTIRYYSIYHEIPQNSSINTMKYHEIQ